jgi:hypothetical protein
VEAESRSRKWKQRVEAEVGVEVGSENLLTAGNNTEISFLEPYYSSAHPLLLL